MYNIVPGEASISPPIHRSAWKGLSAKLDFRFIRRSKKFDEIIREIPRLGDAQRSPSVHPGRGAKRWAHLRKRGIPVDLLRIIVAILLPPLGVFLQVGIGKQFWINILLTILGYIPGIVHAVWVIAKY
jgi:uncharacterized membrane protein YqaE (UPF0057 family)